MKSSLRNSVSCRFVSLIKMIAWRMSCLYYKQIENVSYGVQLFFLNLAHPSVQHNGFFWTFSLMNLWLNLRAHGPHRDALSLYKKVL